MATMAPVRSDSQRQEALALANEVRMARAEIKRRLRRRRVLAWDVIQSKDPLLAGMRIEDVLMAVPKLGETKVRKAFVKAKVSPRKTIGGIHRPQLNALAAQLSENPMVREAVFGVG